MFSKVPGWGSVADGRDHVATTRAFFRSVGSSRDPRARSLTDSAAPTDRRARGGYWVAPGLTLAGTGMIT